MKRGWLALLIAIVAICATAFAGCSSTDTESSASSDALKVTCNNGTMVGQEENGVVSWLGIPYAKPPVGELRWKAPEAAEDSDAEIVCDRFGYTPLRYEWPSEPISYEEKARTA